MAAVTWDLSPFYDGSSGGDTIAKRATRAASVEPISDLKQIRWRRELRVLLPNVRTALNYSPDAASSHEYEIELVKRFAEKHYLELDWIEVDRWEDLVPTLLAGKGDLIAANMTITASRRGKIAFTVPIDTVREKLVVRVGDEINSPADLVGREVAVRERSSFWNLLKEFRGQHDNIELRLLPEHIPAAAILNGVSSGEYDIAAVDISQLETQSGQWPDLKVVEGLTRDSIIAWGVNPEAVNLLAALNSFLGREQLKRQSRLVYKDDLPGIKNRQVLRVLTRNNAANYFVWRGQFLGFEYELMKRFADSQGLHLEMIVPSRWSDLIPTLTGGGGDLIAASMTVTEERKSQGIAFSKPYNLVTEELVGRADEARFVGPENLAGHSVVLRRSSAYWATMQALRDKGIEFELVAAPDNMETEEIIARVASGQYDLTVSDSHILSVELKWRSDIKSVLTLNGPVAHGWAVRAENEKLLAALNEFLDKEYKSRFYNLVYSKYFENSNRIRDHVAAHQEHSEKGNISPYDAQVQKYAEAYGFDWALIVAQMYQESRFDPMAQSWAGARGLMQILPTTGELFGVEDLHAVDTSIETGVRYLAWLHERFEPELSVQDRMWFTLAAYNAGLGHVRDARRLARKMGWNPDRWFDNVERAMLLLSRRSFYQLATHGYARGQETVDYVRQIRDRYNAYVRLASAQ
ncbi:MAG: transporter substrate-binding domain-containing protein [Gammaproteobacteria bacterium]|nr:transporter substrate-binding domain-containing protein [Gammaproteobacteria bacterium]NIM74707.1 transporter substrate-binding domain-containing protein [Gammaproteobacteria bacterium]NIO26540.1 transporter substrate-binding domain-containing protein [Gammaproteobacteria bacterium]NIO67092.1 transporter substrate-binding domain-containing protein [Gammaproteobacteria bacterium]NIP66301.1 transporter substrate-binding domain-containing protein [Gammaproteobacteria bacterium]